MMKAERTETGRKRATRNFFDFIIIILNCHAVFHRISNTTANKSSDFLADEGTLKQIPATATMTTYSHCTDANQCKNCHAPEMSVTFVLGQD